MTDRSITRADVVASITEIANGDLEPVGGHVDGFMFTFANGESAGAVWFRDRLGEPVIGLSVLVADDALDHDLLFRAVATYPHGDNGVGRLEAHLGDDGLVGILAGEVVPLADATGERIRELFAALADMACEARDVLPLRGDPCDTDPTAAWLVMGDDDSYMTEENLREAERDLSRHGVFTTRWNASPKVRFGDLVLVYYRAPGKAVHFVARAASDAYFDAHSDIEVTTDVAPAQWMVDLTVPIEIEPIDFATLERVANGHLNLKGRSGKYLRPEAIDALDFVAVDPELREELGWVTETPVGRPDLPDPEQMSLEQWCAVTAGALENEEQVSQYIVEPLIRLATPTLTAVPQVHLADGGIAGFVLRDDDGRDRWVVEVKQLIERRHGEGVTSTPAYNQLRRYQKTTGLPGLLIDAHRVLAVSVAGRIDFDRTRDSFSDQTIERLARLVRESDGHA
ncbi:MAG: hypothetical protein JST73_01030 [Actinobacteria bacterium]|nr:hypothetical protein [Actinomycetota bacterium]